MKFFNKKLITVIAFTLIHGITCTKPAFAGAPVIDMANLIQNTATKVHVIKQYQTQLEQYKRMLQNSKNLDAFTWDKANITMDNLVNSIDTLNYYKQEAGSLDAYLSQYQNQNHYRSTSCFNGGKCSEEERNALLQHEAKASEAQKRANDAMLRGIEQQQVAMQQEARQLIRLQEQAQGAPGQMAALQAANQLASAETNQLLQIRALLVAEQNAAATRAAAVADKEAIQAAGDEQFRSGSFKKSSGKTW